MVEAGSRWEGGGGWSVGRGSGWTCMGGAEMDSTYQTHDFANSTTLWFRIRRW